jgi:hypothetical protein
MRCTNRAAGFRTGSGCTPRMLQATPTMPHLDAPRHLMKTIWPASAPLFARKNDAD